MSKLCVSWYQSTRVCLFFNISSWHFNIIEKFFDFNLRSSDSSLTYPPVPPPRLAVSAADSQPGLSHPYCHGHAYMNIMGYIYSRANLQLQIFLTLMLSLEYFYGWYQWILTESLTNYEKHHYFLFTPAYIQGCITEKLPPLPSMKIRPANSKNIPDLMVYVHVCILIIKKQIDCCISFYSYTLEPGNQTHQRTEHRAWHFEL